MLQITIIRKLRKNNNNKKKYAKDLDGERLLP
jgi:hypothetical protein